MWFRKKIEKSVIVQEKIRDSMLALPIVQFAIANLPPETTRGWPYEALEKYIESVKAEDLHPELVADFSAFAAECRGYEEMRKANPPKVTKASASDFGPQTEEAKLLHERIYGAVPMKAEQP